MKKLLIILLFVVTFLNATAINTDKEVYGIDEGITVSFTALQGEASEWLAIYPAESNNDFGNIVTWKLSTGTEQGSVVFDALTVGTYDVRIFDGANFIVGKQIVVSENAEITIVETTKVSYLPEEDVVAIFENTLNQNGDWIGIYPAGSNNDWENIIEWRWLTGGTSGTVDFGQLPVGEHEVRVFFNNTFNMEASYAFNVEAAVLNITPRKATYDPYELIHVDFENMRGLESDWIGIFNVGTDNTKESALEWRDAKSLVNGELSFNGLPAGNYEARAYFDAMHEKTANFTVQAKAVNRVLYDDFEDGVIDPRWVRYAGPDMTLLNVGVNEGGVHTALQTAINGQHSLRTYRDYRGGLNYSGYYFDFQNPDADLKFLEVDMRIGQSSHVFAFGVKIKTKFGDRRIEFASWLNHTLPSGQQVIRGPYGNVLDGHREAFTQDNYLHVHPGPTDYYIGTRYGQFVHYKINIEEKLRVLEPDNEFLGVIYFSTSGGDYDNLALRSHL